MQGAAKASALEEPEDDDDFLAAPSQQDLKDFGSKLKDGLVNSDHIIKISTLPSPLTGRQASSGKRQGSLPRLAKQPSQDFDSAKVSRVQETP